MGVEPVLATFEVRTLPGVDRPSRSVSPRIHCMNQCIESGSNLTVRFDTGRRLVLVQGLPSRPIVRCKSLVTRTSCLGGGRDTHAPSWRGCLCHGMCAASRRHRKEHVAKTTSAWNPLTPPPESGPIRAVHLSRHKWPGD